MFVRQWGLTTINLHQDLTVPASDWVVQHATKIKPGGRVLDYACGSGRHTIYLAKQGFQVLAIDRDSDSLAQIKETQAQKYPDLTIDTLNLDLESANWNLTELGTFDGVVVTNYLYRPHLLKLPDLLKPDGVLIYETFALGNEAYGKPSNPDFLLKPNELLNLAEKMRILAYEDRVVSSPKMACIQRVCAVPLQSKV
jgi:SAM-dependent methyltransferase